MKPEPKGAIHVPEEFTRRGLRFHFTWHLRVFQRNSRAIYIRQSPKIYGKCGTCRVFGVLFAGAICVSSAIEEVDYGPSNGLGASLEGSSPLCH